MQKHMTAVVPPGEKNIVLLIKAPKVIQNSQENFAAFFQDFHKFVQAQATGENEQVVSFEVVLKEQYFHYRIVAPSALLSVIESLLYTRFKDIEIVTTQDDGYPEATASSVVEYRLKRSNFFPLKTNFSPSDDPYLVFAALVSKLEHFNEGAVLQLVLRPTSEPWLKQFLREKFYFVVGTINAIKIFFEKPFLEHDIIQYYDEVQSKFSGKQFVASLRVFVYGQTPQDVQENLNLMRKSIDKFDNGDINALEEVAIHQGTLRERFASRRLSPNTILVNAAEVAALFRFPDSNLEVSNVDHISSKKVEPPKELPTAAFLSSPTISTFGITTFRNIHLPFGIARDDRKRHMYIIGKTGMGKSRLMQLLAISDMYQNKGLCVIDPHGDLASDLIRFVPRRRLDDVIYFNPADREYPIGFNPLECHSPEARHHVVTGFIAIFKRQFGATWTSRLEHMLRFIVLALVEAGDATVVDIVKLLTDVEFRHQTIAKLEDPVVKNFWTHEFAAWNEKFDNEAIIPIINQVGQFISNDYIRNVVGQKTSAFDFYRVMQEGKIVIINIAKGKLGEENTALLGSMIITKIQEATMARVGTPEQERREFYLYVDEFQNFATDSFNQILSEARKFNLSLTIAHQYIDQLSEPIRKTVFGNMGSFVCFRVGPEDAHYLGREFAPALTPDDLISLNFREIYGKLSIGGKTSPAFSGKTLDVPQPAEDLTEEIIHATRTRYAKHRAVVSEQFQQLSQGVTHLIGKSEESTAGETQYEEPLV